MHCVGNYAVCGAVLYLDCRDFSLLTEPLGPRKCNLNTYSFDSGKGELYHPPKFVISLCEIQNYIDSFEMGICVKRMALQPFAPGPLKIVNWRSGDMEVKALKSCFFVLNITGGLS